MELRPCIDIHNGKVKQIIGGSLRGDAGSLVDDVVEENFVAELDAAGFANMYRKDGLKGGHVILLNPVTSDYYGATKRQALEALKAWPGGMQLGGGITPENAWEFLEAGASHVIVTSYVFRDGKSNYKNLEHMLRTAGKERLVLDLSCRKGSGGNYYVVTDRWQKYTEEKVDAALLERMQAYADELLIHAVDVEGKSLGIEKELVALLGDCAKIPITYAGGVGSFSDLEELRRLGKNKINVTIGSALDIFGGNMPYKEVLSRV